MRYSKLGQTPVVLLLLTIKRYIPYKINRHYQILKGEYQKCIFAPRK